MPLMLEEDYQISLPSMHRVRQKFDRPRVEDPEGRIRSEFAKEEISGKIRKGQRVAVAVGSRGIRNLAFIVHSIIGEIKRCGGAVYRFRHGEPWRRNRGGTKGNPDRVRHHGRGYGCSRGHKPGCGGDWKVKKRHEGIF